MTRGGKRILPASIRDARGEAFAKVLGTALDEPSFMALLRERIDSAPATLLPALVRELSMEEFVEPDMEEAVVRRLLKEAFALHRMKSDIAGVRHGLAMLGMKVRWVQWFQMTPKGAPGTHQITVYLNEYIFSGQADILDPRSQRAAQRMIAGMKRHSQDEALRIAVGLKSDVRAAAAAAQADTFLAITSAITRRDAGAATKAAAAASHAEAFLAVTSAAARKDAGGRPQAAAAFAVCHFIQL